MTAGADPADLARRLLAVIAHDVLPLTERGVAAGNKVFGAAILDKRDLSLVVAGTNGETQNPLWHGEIATLNAFFAGPRRDPKRLVFLSTHEPCTMCVSAITWAGFDTIYYLFTHEDSRDAFAIPHDLAILKEVFGLDPGGYRRDNAFFRARAVGDLIAAAPADKRAGLDDAAAAVRARYAALSAQYQSGKAGNAIPLR